MPFIFLHNFDTRNIEPVNSELNLADSLINFLSFEGIDLIAPNNNEAFLPNIQNSVSNEPEIQPSTIESHVTRKNERRSESNPFSPARNSAISQRRGVGDVCNNPADHFFWTDKSEKKEFVFLLADGNIEKFRLTDSSS